MFTYLNLCLNNETSPHLKKTEWNSVSYLIEIKKKIQVEKEVANK